MLCRRHIDGVSTQRGHTIDTVFKSGVDMASIQYRNHIEIMSILCRYYVDIPSTRKLRIDVMSAQHRHNIDIPSTYRRHSFPTLNMRVGVLCVGAKKRKSWVDAIGRNMDIMSTSCRHAIDIRSICRRHTVAGIPIHHIRSTDRMFLSRLTVILNHLRAIFPPACSTRPSVHENLLPNLCFSKVLRVRRDRPSPE